MLNTIHSVEQLIETLDNIALSDFPKAIKRIAIKPEKLGPFSTWIKNGYTRNCLARSNKYELILLCWDPKAKTPIHDHGGEDCWVYQLDGEVEEIRYDMRNNELAPSKKIKLSPGNLTFMNDAMGYHAIHNNSESKAMTFHIYASPIDCCKIYNNKDACFESKTMAYDTIAEVVTEYELV